MKAAGWVIAAIAILQIPGWGAWVVYNQRNGLTLWQVRSMSCKASIELNSKNYTIIILSNQQKFKSSFRPAEDWGPKDLKTKREWQKYKKQGVPFQWTPKIKCGKKNKSPPGKYRTSI